MKCFFLFACLFTSSLVFAQDESASPTPTQYSFYGELGGPGILFSVNFDTRFKKSPFGLGARAGLGFVSGYDLQPTNGNYYDDPRSVVTFPLQINYVFGKANSANALEIGAGVTIAGKKIQVFDYYGNDASSVFGTASFMYRRTPINGGFSWRAGFTPIIAKGYIQPFAGVSVGYNF